MAVYITGDIHRMTRRLTAFCEEHRLTQNDTIVLLGDVGANYYLDQRDIPVKEALNKLGPQVLCIHGNHEARVCHLDSVRSKEWNGGAVYYEEDYPNLLYAKDGEVYRLLDYRCMAIGGAYSVDKEIRLLRGWQYFPDEQPDAEIKAYVEAQLKTHSVDVIFSHTCPARYTPFECFLPGIDQRFVDSSTEDWLNEIKERVDYKAWYCGHWHINKDIARVHFLFDGWKILV